MRAGRLIAGIVLILVGLGALGLGYQVKSNADDGYSQYCANIVGAVTQALYTPAAEACQNAQNMSTYGLMGIGLGIVLLILGIVLFALSFQPKGQHQQVSQPQPKYKGPVSKVCSTCSRKVSWYQDAVQEGNRLFHTECCKGAV
jgi:drug/metabolite transporter (DMT)-like permease